LFALEGTQDKIFWPVNVPFLISAPCCFKELVLPIWCRNIALLESLQPRVQSLASQDDGHIKKKNIYSYWKEGKTERLSIWMKVGK